MAGKEWYVMIVIKAYTYSDTFEYNVCLVAYISAYNKLRLDSDTTLHPIRLWLFLPFMFVIMFKVLFGV